MTLVPSWHPATAAAVASQASISIGSGTPIACPLAPDVFSRRTIQCVFYEYPVSDDQLRSPQ